LRVNDQGRIKVLDFGLARRITQATDVTTTGGSETAPQAGLMAGTPGYMAPEQAIGRGAAPAADVFSLGVVLFEMLTGKRPFPGDDFLSAAIEMTTSPAPRIAEFVPDIPTAIEALVARMLAPAPRDRPSAA